MSPPPMVGRDRELALVTDAMADVAAGRPRVVLIDGDAGIGKSRLVEEVLDAAHRAGFVAAIGESAPGMEARVPYKTVMELISELRRDVPDLAELITAEDWRALGPVSGSGGSTSAAGDPGLAALRLHGAFTELVRSLSRRRPIVIVVEDAQWTDTASVEAISYLARRLRGDRVMVIITNRTPQPEGGRGQRTGLAELRRLPLCSGIDLGPLSAVAVTELLDSLPFPPNPGRRQEIVTVSEGVPFYAVHLGRFDDGQLITRHLRDVLLASIDQVTGVQRSVLILLAVLARRAEPEQLSRAIGCRASEFRAAEEGLVDRGLIMADGQSLSYRQHLLREIVLDDARPSERLEAHSQAASMILASPSDERRLRAVELAHHLREAGRHRETLRHGVTAARAAVAVWAFADAGALYSAVRRTWPLVDDPDAAAGLSAARLAYESAGSARWCGDFPEALRLLDEAQSIGGADDVEPADVEYLRGQVLWSAGRMSDSLAAYQRSVSMVGGADAERRAVVLAALAHGWLATGRAAEAEETAAQAIVLAASAEEERPRLQATITRAAARAQLGMVDEAVTELRRCLSSSVALDDLELVLRSYGNLTYALGLACRHAELAEAAEDGIAVCQRYGQVGPVASTLRNNQVNALITLGRWDEAMSAAQDALSDAGVGAVASHLRSLLAFVAAVRGDRSEARRQLELARAAGDDNPYLRSSMAEVEAELALWDNDPSAARAAVLEVLPALAEQDDPLPVLEACSLGLRAAADAAELTVPARRTGPSPQGVDLLELARREAARTRLPVADAVLATCEADAARVVGRDTAEQWRAAADRHGALQRRYWRAYCLLRLGTASLRRQARVAAAHALREAGELAEDLQANPMLAQIGVVITTSGLHRELAATTEAKPQPRSTPLGLTPREREVLPLLATGATNRMIARTLFISERTASVHVSNILAKLGAANRTEAARLAVALHLDSDPAVGG